LKSQVYDVLCRRWNGPPNAIQFAARHPIRILNLQHHTSLHLHQRLFHKSRRVLINNPTPQNKLLPHLRFPRPLIHQLKAHRPLPMRIPIILPIGTLYSHNSPLDELAYIASSTGLTLSLSNKCAVFALPDLDFEIDLNYFHSRNRRLIFRPLQRKAAITPPQSRKGSPRQGVERGRRG